jgi:RNA polymerase sigma factor (sigma-70 family)
MPTPERLAEQFEEHRSHLRAVAYRMLGSASEAEDAVQEGWIRLGRTDVSDVGNLRAWLTTLVARVCLDVLRTRTPEVSAPKSELVSARPRRCRGRRLAGSRSRSSPACPSHAACR